MSFKDGFVKISKSFSSGFSEAAKQTIGDTLKLKGLREAVGDIHKSYSKQPKNLFKTEIGRSDLAHAVAKSTPSLAVGTAYTVGGKKVLDKMKEKDRESQQTYY
jgi:hypothetical protein